jgi:hypothetical protein
VDRHALSLQSAQLTRERNYDDERFNITSRQPQGAPEWTYLIQSTPVDTDFSGPDSPNDNIREEEETEEIEAESSNSAMRDE